MNLAYGTSKALNFIQDFKIYNFSSLKEIGIPLGLLPSNNLGAIDEYEFDCKYAQFIMMNDYLFFSMMNMMMDLYNGTDVFILIADDEESFFNPDVSSWNSILIESFLKFIQQRYGLTAALVETPDDLNTLEYVECSDYGLMNFDEDKERWTFMVEYQRIASGGKPYGYEEQHQ